MIARGGIQHLGGEDFDRRIVKSVLSYCNISLDQVMASDPPALWRLKRAAEEAKVLLSEQQVAVVELISSGPDPPCRVSLTRDEFEYFTSDLFAAMSESVEVLVAGSGIHREEITDVRPLPVANMKHRVSSSLSKGHPYRGDVPCSKYTRICAGIFSAFPDACDRARIRCQRSRVIRSSYEARVSVESAPREGPQLSIGPRNRRRRLHSPDSARHDLTLEWAANAQPALFWGRSGFESLRG